jgi:putative transposase
MLFIQRIAQWLREKRIFRRERTPTPVRALGIALYEGGMGYMKAGQAVGVSHQAVRDWYGRAARYFRSVGRRRRRRVTVDEKLIHLPDGDAWLWAGVDLDTGEVVALMVSRGRSGLEALAFLGKLKRKCAGRLPRVFVDGGEWYPWALERAGFDRWT